MRRIGGSDLVEAPHPAVDRSQEALLFGKRRVENVSLPLPQLGVHSTHQVDYALDDLHEHRSGATEEPGMAHRASENPAEYVPATLVRWKYSVSQQECDCARVIRDHAESSGLDKHPPAFFHRGRPSAA